MLRYLPFMVDLAVLVYCLIDCIQADPDRVRNLSKTGWIVLIVILPIAGGVAWLVAGRPEQSRQGARRPPWPSTSTAGFPEYERPRPLAPDDDPEFLAGLRRSESQHEQMLRDWESQLREREARLADPGAEPGAEKPARDA
ncbi:PLD nuclease N-terminal domain-containing protein [Cellulomonas sp. P22]|uniref:PLD nuclease N-terminal domain-containing protein n=1 Tax=Cellulomonas sp. P22 TaxID=3373189 RepID=UPI00379E86F2